MLVFASQIGTITPFAIVWPVEKFNVLAIGTGEGYG